MKKYLIAGALALVCNGLFTSCSEDLGDYSSLEEAKKAKFAQNFEKFYGHISPNQDWGFGEARVAAARTRSESDNSCGTCIKPDMTNYPRENAPADITEYEREYVKNWFESNPGFTTGLDIKNFYVQHVWGLASKDYLVWYNHYDQNHMNNTPGAPSNWYRDDYTTQGTIDYLCVGDGTNYTHLNDFNANNAGTKLGTVFMENSSALSFKYHCTWSDEEFTYFKCAEIDVPNVGKGLYVGMCMAGEKYDNGERKINKEQLDLEFADDWIVKVIPANGSTITNDKATKVYNKKLVLIHKWVFCEDLGSSSSNKDYDYNDLVFDAKVIKEYKVLRDEDGNETAYTDDPTIKYYAEVTPLAAGGELTIKFDKFSSTAHGMFASGIADNVLINTCRENQEIALSHQERILANTQKYEFTSADDADINNIAILVRTQTAAYDLSAYMGQAPHKICVPPGTRWAYERTDIKEAYTGFEAYVGGGAKPWSTTGVENNLYPLEGAAYEMRKDMTGKPFYEEISSTPSTSYDYTLVDPEHETILWTGENDFIGWDGKYALLIDKENFTKENDEVGDGTVIRFYGINNGYFQIKATPGNTWNSTNLGDSKWSGEGCVYGNSVLDEYFELKLNAESAQLFKENGMRLWGENLKLLCVTYDNSKKKAASGGSGTGEIGEAITVLSNASTRFNGYGNIQSGNETVNCVFDFSKLVSGSVKFEIEFTAHEPGQYEGTGWSCIISTVDGTDLVTARNNDGSSDDNGTRHNESFSGSKDFKETLIVSSSLMDSWRQQYVDWNKHGFKLKGHNVTIKKVTLYTK